MKTKKVTSLVALSAITVSLLAGCGSSSAPAADTDAAAAESGATTAAVETGSTEGTTEEGKKEYSDDEIKDFSMFIAMPGSEINDGNEVQEIIAKKTGVRVKETWLTGQTDAEAVGTIIASGEYPDYINGGDAMKQLYDAGALISWDEYLDKYPKLKAYYTDAEWDSFRQDDGKIYWANVFQNTHGESKTTTHNDEAFWVQARVLEWAGYPKIQTLDEYFKLLEDYAKANPTMEDGTSVIPYTMLCEDWRYFCIENAPQFLDGYPNDGSVIVNLDGDKPTVVDYNTTPTAVKYFKKLNEEYNKGIIDNEFGTQTYDEYIAKLSTGAVLGMCDQWWDFAFTVNDVFKQQGLDKLGCDYVPLGLTIEPGMPNQWHAYGDTLNNSSGVAITTSCQDVDAAFQFLEDCLDQEIHDLRFWGVEGVDYEVDENGLYYRTEDERMKATDTEYQASHLCDYSYMPQWGGTSEDGKNAMMPTEQTSEFFANLADPLVKCFEAYNATTYVDMIGSEEVELGPWYPMYSFSNAMTTDTPGGVAWTKMGETKHEWLPKVVMSKDFDSAWSDYMDAYSACKPEDFLSEMQEELDRRAANQ